MEFDWRFESRELITDATKIVRAIENMADEELAFRKSIGEVWHVHDESDMFLANVKLTIAKLENVIGSNNAIATADLHGNLITSLREINKALKSETMINDDQETNKNIIIRHINGVSLELRKHRLEILNCYG